MTPCAAPWRRQRGLVLVIGLLLMLVMTIIALGMFRSNGIQEKIAGNVREKQRATHAAQSAQQYAEWWLSQTLNTANVTVVPIVCNSLLDANLNQGQICSNTLRTVVAGSDVTKVPWKSGSAEVGVNFTPANMTVTSAAAAAAGTYAARPRFYIGYLGKSATGQGDVYQIDSVGYGGGANTVAVIESTYSVYVSSWSVV